MATKAAATPAAKPVSNQGSPESVAARGVTRQANATLVIDYSAGRKADSFSATGRTSFWVQKLNKLAADVENGVAESGVFYQIGEFSTASTAQSTRKRIETDHVDELRGTFAMQTERTEDGSALFAAAYADDEDEDDAPKQKPVAGDDGDEWGTE